MALPALTAIALTASVALSPAHQPGQPVSISKRDMPKIVPLNYQKLSEKQIAANSSVALYHELKGIFGISHTKMSCWLGVKRRSLYNWLDNPQKSTVCGPMIEERLSSLSKLRSEMEPDHTALLHKIAFSPIHGDPSLGEALMAGASAKELIQRYDRLFSQFEAYLKLHSTENSLG